MSKKENMKKYRINGLDCAQCANEIESGLRKIEGLKMRRSASEPSRLLFLNPAYRLPKM